MASLLRLDEIKEFLTANGLVGLSSLRRREVLQFLRQAHAVPLSRLAAYVRERLTNRLPQRLLDRAMRKAERQQRPARKRRKKPSTRRRKRSSRLGA
ncbi:hypothetical protein [Hymenobacter sp. AT01-02]|uniref:hypothetical protein n=1 Tax=Hymenobacter sp. AT01-02 TaxID=1571877 RepID=UPI00128FC3EE|nr:hypothetical protein [Hymenobacter sp. AT01-02]